MNNNISIKYIAQKFDNEFSVSSYWIKQPGFNHLVYTIDGQPIDNSSIKKYKAFFIKHGAEPRGIHNLLKLILERLCWLNYLKNSLTRN